MLYADLYLIGATFTNNNSTPFHLSHIFKLAQQTTKLVTEAYSQVWIKYERKLSIKFNMRFGAQKNRLNETVILSTHSICFG